MEERLKQYLIYAKNLQEKCEKEGKVCDEKICQEMLVQIGFFQHERLVHLIVTVTFAILTLLSLLGALLVETSSVFLLTLLFVVLLIPYIRHYYILENGVQKLYGYYDKIR